MGSPPFSAAGAWIQPILLKIPVCVARPGGALGVAEHEFLHGPDALVVDERLLGLEGALDLVPRHRGVVLRRDAVLGVPGEPLEALAASPLSAAAACRMAGSMYFDAEGRERHQVVGTGLGRWRMPHLGRALVDDLLGEVRQVRHRELALLDVCRQALDEGLVLADLAQHVLVVEEHADLGILRDARRSCRRTWSLPTAPGSRRRRPTGSP